jgi:hypothetical protein
MNQNIKWFVLFISLLLGLTAAPLKADTSYKQQYRYKYISLTNVPVPTGYAQFIPWSIDDKGRVIGHIGSNDGPIVRIAIYNNGKLSVYQQGEVVSGAVNARGTIGGGITDPITFNSPAALFRGNHVEIIPNPPGVTFSYVASLNDSDTALIYSDPGIYRLVKNGKALFNFTSTVTNQCQFYQINNMGVIAGNCLDSNLNLWRAVRFRPPYKAPEYIDHAQTVTESTAIAINNSGLILGTTAAGLGIWDQKGKFKSYYQGSFGANLFNDKNLIVLGYSNAYIVPSPGVVLNVQDLLVNPTEVESPLQGINDVNNNGDMVGIGSYNAELDNFPTFLLKRISNRDLCTNPSPQIGKISLY